jgi:hypothetical protein
MRQDETASLAQCRTVLTPTISPAYTKTRAYTKPTTSYRTSIHDTSIQQGYHMRLHEHTSHVQVLAASTAAS